MGTILIPKGTPLGYGDPEVYLSEDVSISTEDLINCNREVLTRAGIIPPGYSASKDNHQVSVITVPCPKVRYGHKETAETAAESMHKKTGDDYDAYQCPYPPCGAWHIGHSKETA